MVEQQTQSLVADAKQFGNGPSEHIARHHATDLERRSRRRMRITGGDMSDWVPRRTAALSPETLLLKPVDAARILAISPRTLWGLTDRGEIPCVRIGRSVRYDRHDLAAWIAKKKNTNAKHNGMA